MVSRSELEVATERGLAMTEAWREEIRKEAERIHESAMCASEAQFAYAKRWRWVDWTLRGIAASWQRSLVSRACRIWFPQGGQD